MNLPELTAPPGILAVAPYVILYLIPAVITAELALYGWHWRHIDAAVPFCLLMIAVVLWSVCHALSVASSSLPTTLFWAQIQYAGIVLIGPIWLLFALAYRGGPSQVLPKLGGWLLVPAGLSYAAVLSNERHHLWWPTVALDTTRPFGSLAITRGVLFWLHYSYSYSCVLLGFGLIVHRMFTAPPLQQRQARMVAIAALFPIAGNLAHILGLRTAVVDDPTPFLFAASGLLIFYAALRYQFPDLAPVAPQTLLASLPDGLVVLDRRGIVTALNDRVPRLLELATEGRNWLGRTFQRIIAGSPLEIDLRALLIAPAAAASRMISYTHQQGLRGVELRLRPLYAHNVYAGSLLMVRDRTERAQMEQTIERRMNELMMLNRLARAINATDMIDDLMRALIHELPQILPSGRVVIGLLQPDGASLHRLADERLDSTMELDTQVATDKDLEMLHNVLNIGQPQVVNVSEPLLEGTATQAILQQSGLRSVLLVPLTRQAEPLGVLFIGHADDRIITPTEVQLFVSLGELVTEAMIRTRLSGQGREANPGTSTVLAAITHELRTPLTSIIGFTDMLGRGIFGELPEHVYEPLAHMRRNSQTLLRLINDILNYSRIEAGRFTIDLAPVDLSTVIRDVVGAMQPQIQERGLALKLELAADVPPVYADRERLEQVLTNLVANAIKFTEQGSITVRTAYQGEHARFSVTDTGIGIAPEQQRVVFQEYQQIDNEYQDRYPGTGLGLTISRRLMELMGGTLTLESTLGCGSTFSGDVPIVPEALEEKECGHTP